MKIIRFVPFSLGLTPRSSYMCVLFIRLLNIHLIWGDANAYIVSAFCKFSERF